MSCANGSKIEITLQGWMQAKTTHRTGGIDWRAGELTVRGKGGPRPPPTPKPAARFPAHVRPGGLPAASERSRREAYPDAVGLDG